MLCAPLFKTLCKCSLAVPACKSPVIPAQLKRCHAHSTPSAAVQMSQLNELLILLGHEDDAATLQAALDAYVKGFIAAAQDILEHPPPPASAAAAAEDAARKTVGTIQNKLYELERSVWKWDLLRRDEGDTADDCAADGVGSQTESTQRRV